MKARALIGTLGLLAASSASLGAAPADSSADPVRHCIVEARELGAAEAKDSSKVSCYSSQDEADAAIDARTGAAHRHQLEGAELQAAQTQYVIGVAYEHDYFNGSRLTFYTTNVDGCTTGTSYGVSSFSGGWNDEISSWREYQGCNKPYWYSDSGYSGDIWGNDGGECFLSSDPYGDDCATMGWANDEMSSVVWRAP